MCSSSRPENGADSEPVSRAHMSRDFGHCMKCLWADLSVVYHGTQGCVPMGSDNPCWEFHWAKQEHFRITCRRCGFARTDGVTPTIEAVPA